MTPTEQSIDDPEPVRTPVQWWVRGVLLAMAAVVCVVFVIATQVQPYKADGTAKRQASHTSIGMAPCRFQEVANMPCPSCGMTTSFALLVRGDVINSMRANWVGTGLAVFCALFVPWCVVSSIRGKYLWVRRLEAPLAFLVGTFTVLMLGRWGVVLLMSVFD